MITSLRLGNFKAFAETQTIPIRPLTIIFGANSSGKSSIIHSLLLANESIGSADLDISHTEIGGEAVDLGGFRQYIHKTDALRRMEIGFNVTVNQSGTILPQGTQLTLTSLIGMEHDEIKEEREGTDPRNDQPILIQVPTGKFRAKGSPRTQSFTVSLDEKEVARLDATTENEYRLRLNTRHPFVVDLLKAVIEISTTAMAVTDDDLSDIGEHVSEYLDEIKLTFHGIIPDTLGVVLRLGQPSPSEIITVSRANRKEELNKAIELFLPPQLTELLLTPTREIESWLESLVYLGPLRSFPHRHLAFSKEHDPNWLAGGGYAWDIVKKNAEIRKSLNEWLGSDRLQTRYELRVRDLIPGHLLPQELPEKISAAITDGLKNWFQSKAKENSKDLKEFVTSLYEQFVLDDQIQLVDDTPLREFLSTFFDVEKSSETWVQELSQYSPDQLSDLVMIDKRTNSPVTHRDIGIGISQVLPVLVYSMANRSKVIAIEQPEIHLHPALQADLADVFIESALGDLKNKFILETHSEHIILRILRRIRESTAGKNGALPAVRPDDVSLVFVGPGKNGAEVIPIRIDERGRLIDRVPGGFFEEDFAELF